MDLVTSVKVPGTSTLPRPCDQQVPPYCCRAYYDSDNLPEAKKTLLKAMHVAPTNHRLRFDAALTMQVRCMSEPPVRYLLHLNVALIVLLPAKLPLTCPNFTLRSLVHSSLIIFSHTDLPLEFLVDLTDVAVRSYSEGTAPIVGKRTQVRKTLSFTTYFGSTGVCCPHTQQGAPDRRRAQARGLRDGCQ